LIRVEGLIPRNPLARGASGAVIKVLKPDTNTVYNYFQALKDSGIGM
jgi:hypothetical protein